MGKAVQSGISFPRLSEPEYSDVTNKSTPLISLLIILSANLAFKICARLGNALRIIGGFFVKASILR
jgi:hypothetical protein